MVDIATGEANDRELTPEEQGKDPAAVARGKLGGAKGGRARANALSPQERSESARKAVRARWAVYQLISTIPPVSIKQL